MSTYLAPLTRGELDEFMRMMEHAERVAHIALINAPLRFEALADACGVCQDVMCVLRDCYDASMLMFAGDFDRAFGVDGG